VLFASQTKASPAIRKDAWPREALLRKKVFDVKKVFVVKKKVPHAMKEKLHKTVFRRKALRKNALCKMIISRKIL